jgi:3-methylcrotonyl-CoA carboxylase alpha subunit
LERSKSRLRCSLDGLVGLFHFAADHRGVTIGFEGRSYRFSLFRPSVATGSSRLGGDVICAPMPGVVLAVEAVPGAKVRAGDVLVLLESMKMEFPLRSPRDGELAAVDVAKGDHVGLDEALARLVPLSPGDGASGVGDKEGP